MEQLNKFTHTIVLFSLSTLLGSITASANTSMTTKFSANIAFEPGCEISVTNPVISFNKGKAILPRQVENNAEAANETFNLILSKCEAMNITPKITVIGESNDNTGETLFLNSAASIAKGYGVLLKTTGNSIFKKNDNLALVKTISVNDDWNADPSSTNINGTIPIAATLSCGNCSEGDRSGGNIFANITFEIQYE